MAEQKPKKQSNKVLWIIVLILSVLLISVGLGITLWVYMGESVDFSDFRKETHASGFVPIPTGADAVGQQGGASSSQGGQNGDTQLRSNPVDFEKLQKLNKDIYAWIYIPNTDIDLPVFQASADKDDNFYMYHNAKGEYEFKGSIYSQRLNEKDFQDPVTVLYGHHMLDKSMFSNLHYFMDSRFFEENEYFYIYTPGHILTYRIVSAHEYDERHILNSFDFSKEKVYRDYLNYIMEPRTMVANVRRDTVLTTQNRIVTLSTCTEDGSGRYLVQGVLIYDEPTTD